MEPELIQVIELIIAAAMAVFAYVKNHQKNLAVVRTAQAEAQAVRADAQTTEVIRYFDPTDDTVTTAPSVLPSRTYKMTNETKRWITFDHTPEEKEYLLRQIAEAEAEGKDTYTLDYAGGYYEIEYGLLKGGAGCAKQGGGA
jgi:hypothetical protein